MIIAPSILSADFTRLGEEIEAVDAAGADWIHVDVMDGHFVPAITFGPMVVAAARRRTKKPLNVHLMVADVERHIASFAQAGADHILVHAEPAATIHLHHTLGQIAAAGKLAGVVLNPATPLDTIEYVLHLCAMVLVMTVNPGAGGQAFLPEMLPKIQRLRHRCRERQLSPVIAVDGGQDCAHAAKAVAAGADAIIAGSAIFGASDYAAAIANIRARCHPAAQPKSVRS